MIFLVPFGINKHLWIFQRPKIALALRARALSLVFEKFTRAYLFQIALEIMWLPKLIAPQKGTELFRSKLSENWHRIILYQERALSSLDCIDQR